MLRKLGDDHDTQVRQHVRSLALRPSGPAHQRPHGENRQRDHSVERRSDGPNLPHLDQDAHDGTCRQTSSAPMSRPLPSGFDYVLTEGIMVPDD